MVAQGKGPGREADQEEGRKGRKCMLQRLRWAWGQPLQKSRMARGFIRL